MNFKCATSRVAVLKKEVGRLYSDPALNSGAGTCFEQRKGRRRRQKI